MLGKIGLEEHFAIPETVQDSAGFVPDDHWGELKSRILDMQDRRIREMDANGMEMMLISLNAPAIQAIHDVKKACDMARLANDRLADEVAKRPDRFQGLAALPLQDAEAASQELTRCVKELGFKGALVNGFSQAGSPDTVLYYDLPQYRPFWKTVSELDVPFYLHPRNPIASWAQIYEGHAWLLGPTWAFAQETAVHSLRLIGSGLFDEFPNLQIVIGHLGEGLPFNMWRIDHRNAWVKAPHKHKAKNKIAHYFNANFHITTSGNFRTQTLVDTMMEVGADRVLFSTDWPFENVDHAAIWFDNASISEADRVKIGRTNAIKLFKLNLK
jgi:2,3-dihydroxybenzoate decarboxylase